MKPKAIADGIKVWCSHDEIGDIEKAIENPRNPNKHPEMQIKLLANIIKAQGWRNPITISNLSGFITKGAGRLTAARVLGVSKVPLDFQDYENDAAEYADLIADNRIAELAEPDLDLVKDILESIEGLDAELTGYNLDELNIDEETEKETRGINPPDSAYEVVVSCESEETQEETYNDLIAKGYDCRILTL